MVWKKPFKNIAANVKNPFRKFKLYIKQQLGWLGEPKILPFRGYGNDQIVFIKGRVLEDNGLAKAAEKDNLFANIWAMVKRFISDEIPGVHVKIYVFGIEKTAETNEDGIFEEEFDLQDIKIPYYGWHQVEFELLDKVKEDQAPIFAKGQLLIPSETDAEYGIISDIDDTFLVSHATNFMKKMRLMLVKNARTRVPFEGVGAFYRSLENGIKAPFNPFFYVSSSEYNLYDLLVDFCHAHKIPDGVFLLQDLKTSLKELIRSGGGSHRHKFDKIETLLTTYRHMKFVLIGDSGQHDAEIYEEIALKYPDRVKAIYIRDVKKSRHSVVTEISENLRKSGIEMLLVKTTIEAAIHAVHKSFIKKNTIKEIKADKEFDEHAPTEFQYIFREKETGN